MKHREKQQAIELRRSGKSIKEIAGLLSVSKASVSLWVRDIALSPKQKQQLSQKSSERELVERRRNTRLANEFKKRNLIIELAEKDIGSIDLSELKLVGCSLYFAEGGKTQRGMARFSNSNPDMIKIMMKFFKEVCGVPDAKFRGHIHTHAANKVANVEEYWSEITGIPKRQFFKTYFKPPKSSSQNKKNLEFGTFDIYVCDTNLFLKIQGWTQKMCKMILSKTSFK